MSARWLQDDKLAAIEAKKAKEEAEKKAVEDAIAAKKAKEAEDALLAQQAAEKKRLEEEAKRAKDREESLKRMAWQRETAIGEKMEMRSLFFFFFDAHGLTAAIASAAALFLTIYLFPTFKFCSSKLILVLYKKKVAYL